MPDDEPRAEVTDPPYRRASTTSYVVLGVIMAAAGVFFFSRGTEPIGHRDIPGWVGGCVCALVVVSIAWLLRVRSRGKISRLERPADPTPPQRRWLWPLVGAALVVTTALVVAVIRGVDLTWQVVLLVLLVGSAVGALSGMGRRLGYRAGRELRDRSDS